MKLKSLGMLAASAIVSVAFAQSVWAADYTLSVNTALTTSDPLYKGLEAFRDGVAEASGGKMEIKLFPNSQLGPDEDVLEQARSGAPVAVVVDGGRLAVYQKELGILGAPYLASGYDGIRKVVTSDLFWKWADELNKSSGLQILSFNWWQGERQLWTNKPIEKPEDLSGVRMRTPGAPVWVNTIKAMGATPTPMGWTDVYSALQTNTIDAVEAQLPAAYGSKLYEVTKNLTFTHHINLITGLVTSGGWFNGLPEDMQKMLKDQALKAGDIASHGTQDSLDKIESDLKEKGMQVAHIDVAPFKKATEVVYEQLGYADLHKQLEQMLGE